MEEIWKNIPDYEEAYQISNLGRVKSFKYDNRILVPVKKTTGYYCVSLSKNNVRRHYNIHRLVAEAFIENPDSKREINHKNCDKSDNKKSNLEWCSSKQNKTHAVSNGLNNPGRGKRPVIKLSLSGEVLCEYESIAEAARSVKVSRRAIGDVLKGVNKTSVGFKWKYKQ